MAIAGALIGKAIGAFGRKPDIPNLPQIDPNQVQREAVAANLGALPEAQKLAAGVNEFNFTQTQDMFRRALEFIAPGQLGQVQNIVQSQLRGEIPADVQQSVLRSGAARALAGGTAGSSFASNLTLRDLGITSLQLQQQGFSNFGALASMAPKAPTFDLTSMFYTPQQRLEFAFQDRNARFQRDLLAEQVAAAPDPATAAIGREVDRFFNTWAQAGMMGLGQMGGGGMKMG